MTTSGRLSDTDIAVTSTPSSSGTGAPAVNAETAKQAAAEAKNVTIEAKEQATQMLSGAKQELHTQAAQSRDKLTSTLRSLSSDMDQMASSNPSTDGMAAQAIRKLAETARTSADYLEQRDPASLANELRDFARQRPGTFLLGAAIAGGIAGRLTRSAVDQRSSSSQPSTSYDATYAPTPRNADLPIAASTYDALNQTEGVRSTEQFDPVGHLSDPSTTGIQR